MTAIDYDSYLQQMLYYIASCKSRPVHIAGIRDVFGIDDDTIDAASRGLVHIDALVTALSGALEQLNSVVTIVNTHDLEALLQALRRAKTPLRWMPLTQRSIAWLPRARLHTPSRSSGCTPSWRMFKGGACRQPST